MAGQSGQKFDHVVAVMFENRTFDNLLGRLYQPGEVASFEGVPGKELTNPIPDWAEHGADRKVVPYGVAAGMNVPDPDSGEDFPHVNTQLFGVIDPPGNRCVLPELMTAPFNAPADPAAVPTMDGFVADYISAFTAQKLRQPTYQEYAQIMTGYTPEQVPVISAIARGFATFDHWHSDVPSQTFTNRSFYHAASSSGFVVNAPYENFPLRNDAETIFERLEAAGLPWRIYVDNSMRLSATGMIHALRLRPYFATRFSTLADFFDDAERGRLPAYSFIEPCLIFAHNDYHPVENPLAPGRPSTRCRRSWAGRSCWPASTPRCAPRKPPAAPTSPTPCSWSPSTSMAAPTIMFRRRGPIRPTRRPRPARWGSGSTGPGSASPPWRYRPTSTRRPSSPADTATPR